MGVVWATCATLPFFETFIFNAHVSSGRQRLSTDDYLRMGLLFVSLWASMCGVFLIEKSHVTRMWLRVREEFQSWREKLKDLRSWAIKLLILMALAYMFVGRRALLETFKSSTTDYLLDILLLLAGAALIWIVARFVRSLGESLSTGMREGVDNWAIGLRTGVFFYVFLVGGTLIWVSFRGVSPAMLTAMRLSLIKDFALLFIISGLLYLGLFKLARARALLDVFQNLHGFIHFVLICGIIAIFAVWADYRELDPLRMERIFNNEWQRQYMEFHVVIRDIFLLLLPIGFLLFWTLQRVAIEAAERKVEPRK